jgi:MoxR-like ATPase
MEAVPESMRSDSAANNLPLPLDRFIGREQEMVEVKALLAASRLLTLTGAGGSGKTRLALQVATDLLHEFRQGSGGSTWQPSSIRCLCPRRWPRRWASPNGRATH